MEPVSKKTVKCPKMVFRSLNPLEAWPLTIINPAGHISAKFSLLHISQMPALSILPYPQERTLTANVRAHGCDSISFRALIDHFREAQCKNCLTQITSICHLLLLEGQMWEVEDPGPWHKMFAGSEGIVGMAGNGTEGCPKATEETGSWC